VSIEKEINLDSKGKVTLRVIVFRHGPKLSAAGEKNAKAAYFDDSVRQGFDKLDAKDGIGLARVATSSVQRAVDTANIAQEELSGTSHRTKEYIRKDEKLEVPFQPLEDAKEKKYAADLGRIVAMQKEMQPMIVEEIEKEYPDLNGEAKEAEIRNRMDMKVLSEMFDEENDPFPARRFETTYGELADIFAKRYFGFSHHLNLLDRQKEAGGKQPAGDPYLQIDVTHSFPVMAFLKKYLVFEDGMSAEELASEEFFKKTGGIIRESGSFEIDFINSDPPKIKVAGEFYPGKKFEGLIDLEKMKHGQEKK